MHKHRIPILLAAALLVGTSLGGCRENGAASPPPIVQVPVPPPPTPTPVPTPPPAPQPGLERPSALNTGPRAGITLQNWTGPSYDNRSNLVIDGYDLPAPAQGYYTFSGTNVTLRNCRIRAGILFSGDNITLERCEVIGGVSLSGVNTAVIEYNNIHDSTDDGMHVTSDSGQVRHVRIAHNFIHSFVYPAAIACSDPHSDGIQVRGVDSLTLFNNVFDMGSWQTICNGRYNPLSAALFLQDANGGNRNILVDRNYLNGGAIVARIGPGPNTRFTNNRFGRDERYGLVEDISRPGDIVDKSGNVRDDDNASVNF